MVVLTRLVAGIDEAGRGPLAGPVIAAAVVIEPGKPLPPVRDSKQLSPEQRLELFEAIQKQSEAWAIGRAEVYEIDNLNIFQATLIAMQRAVAALSIQPHRIYVDGTHCPEVPYPISAIPIPQGDQLMPVISAASIIAKVVRDQEMLLLDQQYPKYGFAQHKGYPTEHHQKALLQYGPTPHHRRSFTPVRKLLDMID